MNTVTAGGEQHLSRLKLFLALSRTPHAALDMATPGLTALLWLGTLPSKDVVGVGLATAFAGYTAVYALNDVADYRVDREKIKWDRLQTQDDDLDSVYVRHPMARGLLGFTEAAFWTGTWGTLALVGSYILNPACAFIFLTAVALEIVYCLLLKVSHLRTALSGAVKTSGGIAAIFAVDPSPSLPFLIAVFLWLFFWEIGGQNVPNDLTDLPEDLHIQAKTVPVRLGPRGSARVISVCLLIAVVLSLSLFWLTAAELGAFYLAGAFVSGLYFLLVPAYRLLRTGAREDAAGLFNRASYYPVAMLSVVVMSSVA